MRMTPEEIADYRSELAEDADALSALDMIEDCEGDLEDAAIALALRAGQEPDETERWLEGLAKRWRVFLCQTVVKDQLAAGAIANVLRFLASETSIPATLKVPVVLYVMKAGVEDFCKPLQEKI
jgi:hypothetical protein